MGPLSARWPSIQENERINKVQIQVLEMNSGRREASPPIDCLMPASETPTNPPVPTPEAEQPVSASTAVQERDRESSGSGESRPNSSENGRGLLGGGYSTSRYVDYDTHELLERISQ